MKRILLVWLAAAYVFWNFYGMVANKENQLRTGKTVYLKLAPIDPRALLQGDYMALNYDLSNEIRHKISLDRLPSSGAVVIFIDPNNLGHFVRLHDKEKLESGEYLLQYHHRDWHLDIGAEQFFIPEGSGENFSHAVYGELKISPDGAPLLTALCDETMHPIQAVVPASR